MTSAPHLQTIRWLPCNGSLSPEGGAGWIILRVRICAGGAEQSASLPRPGQTEGSRSPPRQPSVLVQLFSAGCDGGCADRRHAIGEGFLVPMRVFQSYRRRSRSDVGDLFQQLSDFAEKAPHQFLHPVFLGPR